MRPETHADAPAISHLITDVFQSGAEARLVERLRDEGFVLVSLVAVLDQRIVRNAVFSHLTVSMEDGPIEAAALAPIAVHRDFQCPGIGSAMLVEGLRICRERGKDAVIVSGDPHYYARFGFTPDLAAGIESKYSGPAFMAVELTPGILRNKRGKASYPSPFDEVT